ncbi:MAG: hypothetical protein GX633_00140 [Clostridiales bacterium]|nr:hypothetical protein [Clostridiales bacterium]
MLEKAVNFTSDLARGAVHKGIELYENREMYKNRMIDASKAAYDRFTSLDCCDLALIKVAVLSLGVSLGAYFSRRLRKLVPVFLAISAAISIYLIIKAFICDED